MLSVIVPTVQALAVGILGVELLSDPNLQNTAQFLAIVIVNVILTLQGRKKQRAKVISEARVTAIAETDARIEARIAAAVQKVTHDYEEKIAELNALSIVRREESRAAIEEESTRFDAISTKYTAALVSIDELTAANGKLRAQNADQERRLVVLEKANGH